MEESNKPIQVQIQRKGKLTFKHFFRTKADSKCSIPKGNSQENKRKYIWQNFEIT